MKFMIPGIIAKNEGETFKGDLPLSVGRISGTTDQAESLVIDSYQ